MQRSKNMQKRTCPSSVDSKFSLMSLKVLVAACSWPLVVMQSTGNQHHAGYSPPCGACEGVDGIASSDTASDIKIFPCKIDASTVNLPGDSGEIPSLGSLLMRSSSGRRTRVCSREIDAVVEKTLLEAAFNGAPSVKLLCLAKCSSVAVASMVVQS